jgi:CBS domain-containing membrane protein
MIKVFLQRMRGGYTSPPRKPLRKIAWSWLGAFAGIYIISILHKFAFLDIANNLFLIGSFGASAVLIYGTPQVEFAQPRNLVGGHIISALLGISAYKYLQIDISLVGAIAVSGSVVAMHFTRTLHPPGGATALIAVIGSEKVHDLGYMFIFFPVAIDSLILLIIALLVNNLSKNTKRHYPRYWL